MKKHNKSKALEQESEIKDLRAEIELISDCDLLLFRDRIFNQNLQSITQFIEAKAYDESREKETF
jgi:cell fate (sporulation/competence/biofilm development) regulator YmcA (YheA/YmcA/DUF963 family)